MYNAEEETNTDEYPENMYYHTDHSKFVHTWEGMGMMWPLTPTSILLLALMIIGLYITRGMPIVPRFRPEYMRTMKDAREWFE